jgi:hypothetical protein
MMSISARPVRDGGHAASGAGPEAAPHARPLCGAGYGLLGRQNQPLMNAMQLAV